jgi:hypothetical protein
MDVAGRLTSDHRSGGRSRAVLASRWGWSSINIRLMSVRRRPKKPHRTRARQRDRSSQDPTVWRGDELPGVDIGVAKDWPTNAFRVTSSTQGPCNIGVGATLAATYLRPTLVIS